MLTFFRKYQKVFFIIVTVSVVASFSFFGTYGAMQSAKTEKDKEIGKAIDGSSMYLLDIDRMSRFLMSDRLDNEGDSSNLFNDGVIRSDVFVTGIGAALFEAFADELKEEIGQKIERFKTYQPYVHPGGAFLSAELIWSLHMPSLWENLTKIKKEENSEADTMKILVDLYLDQTKFPSYLLRQALWYQQNKMAWLPKDPTIERGDLSLFHAHNLRDWFGDKYVHLVAQFIHNASLIAKQKGYKVSSSEARSDLYRIGYETLQAQQKDRAVSTEELAQAFKYQMGTLGLDEEKAIQIWQRVLLFRKLFNDVGGSVFVDRQGAEQFHEYAHETLQADLYQLPKEFQFTTFRDLLKFQCYLETIAKMKDNSLNSLQFPEQTLTLQQIERVSPELIYRQFALEVAEINLEEVSQAVGLKETWAWQGQLENWKSLQMQFPELVGKTADKMDEVPEKNRQKIDQYCREQITLEHPEWIEEQLGQAPAKEKSLLLTLEGGELPFEGKVDRQDLLSKLDSESEIPLISFDNVHYYSIKVLSKSDEKGVLTFKEANKQNILNEMLDRKLLSSYSSVKAKEPLLFQKSDGEWKPLEEVSDEVGKYVYEDLCKMIEKEVETSKGKLPVQGTLKQPFEFYVTNRFLRPLKKAKQALKIGDVSALKQEDGSLTNQWGLEKTSLKAKRKEKNSLVLEKHFDMEEGAWSDVLISDLHQLYFFTLTKKGVDTSGLSEKLDRGQQLLSLEARKQYADQMINELIAKQSIHLQSSIEEVHEE